MTNATLTITLLLAVTPSACGRDAALREEEGRRAAADSAPVAADSARRVAAADSVRRAQERARITETLAERIGFAFDRSMIQAADRPILQRKVELLRANTSIRIQLAGHCDIRGSDRYNQALGMRRAEAAKQYLTSAGVAADRIDVVSYGKTRPLDPGTTRAAHARNRRVEFTIAG